MNYKTRFLILISIIIILIVAVGVIYYNWQNRTIQPTAILNQNQPVSGVVPEEEVIEIKTAAPVGTLEYCQLFEGGEYTTCVLNLAYKDNSLQYCDLVDDAVLKEHCNNRVGLQIAVNQDMSQCFSLAEVVRTSCVLQHLDKVNDKNKACNQLNEQSQQEFCLQLIQAEIEGLKA